MSTSDELVSRFNSTMKSLANNPQLTKNEGQAYLKTYNQFYKENLVALFLEATNIAPRSVDPAKKAKKASKSRKERKASREKELTEFGKQLKEAIGGIDLSGRVNGKEEAVAVSIENIRFVLREIIARHGANRRLHELSTFFGADAA